MNISQQSRTIGQQDAAAQSVIKDFRIIADWYSLIGEPAARPFIDDLDLAAPDEVRAALERIQELPAEVLMLGSPQPDPVGELDEFIEGLPERLRIIATHRVFTMNPRTQLELGRHLGLSASRVSQLEHEPRQRVLWFLERSQSKRLVEAIERALSEETGSIPLNRLTDRFPVLLKELRTTGSPLWFVLSKVCWEINIMRDMVIPRQRNARP